MKATEVREDYFDKHPAVRLAMETGRTIKKARIDSGLTQKQLAHKMDTEQPSIARAESGGYLISLNFLLRVAKACGKKLKSPEIV